VPSATPRRRVGCRASTTCGIPFLLEVLYLVAVLRRRAIVVNERIVEAHASSPSIVWAPLWSISCIAVDLRLAGPGALPTSPAQSTVSRRPASTRLVVYVCTQVVYALVGIDATVQWWPLPCRSPTPQIAGNQLALRGSAVAVTAIPGIDSVAGRWPRPAEQSHVGSTRTAPLGAAGGDGLLG